MGTVKEYFGITQDASKGVSQKNDLVKRAIITHMAGGEHFTLAELSDALNVSVPTMTKLVAELTADGIVTDFGKAETPGGRRPNIFGLTPSAIYFAGTEVSDSTLTIVITDIRNRIVASKEMGRPAGEMTNALETAIAATARHLGTENILGHGFSFAGQADPQSGIIHTDAPETRVLEERFGTHVHIESSTRARAYADHTRANARASESPAAATPPADSIYIELGDSSSLAIIAGGRLYYGNSGLAGSFGHLPMFDNGTDCMCGKKGCLDTEASVRAIGEKAAKAGRAGELTAQDIITAVERGDALVTTLLEDAAAKVGRATALLINLLNPGEVVVGGPLAAAGDYLMLPLRQAANKHSLAAAYRDTRFRAVQPETYDAALGAAILIRNKTLGLL